MGALITARKDISGSLLALDSELLELCALLLEDSLLLEVTLLLLEASLLLLLEVSLLLLLDVSLLLELIWLLVETWLLLEASSVTGGRLLTLEDEDDGLLTLLLLVGGGRLTDDEDDWLETEEASDCDDELESRLLLETVGGATELEETDEDLTGAMSAFPSSPPQPYSKAAVNKNTMCRVFLMLVMVNEA